MISCEPVFQVNTAEPSGATLISGIPAGPRPKVQVSFKTRDRRYLVVGEPNAGDHRFRAGTGVVHPLVIRRVSPVADVGLALSPRPDRTIAAS